MLKRFLILSAFGALALSGPCVAFADDQVRSAQEALKSQGFYSGPVDGELNADTTGAIRRYQIRNGLEGTGQLTPDTVTALSKGDQAAPAASGESQPSQETAPTPTPVIPAPTVPSAGNPPASAERDPARVEPANPVSPEAPSAVVRPGPPSGASDPAYAEIYRHTPYQNAPAEVQRDTLRKAQEILARRRLYDGVPNGQPGPDTDEALIRFQSVERLPRTGRMDIDTIARLHLLPVSRLPRHPGEPPVYRGRVPRDYPPGEEPAVRGIPVD